jgi:nucleotide-binding universal stress UspA family protein
VLAVAGAAHGSFLLVVLGLLISIPIVIWGSTFLLKYVERYPAFVYVGAGVLAWTAAKMMTSEPLLKDAFTDNSLTVPLLYAVTVFGVLWGGLVANHRRLESRIGARVASFAGGIAGGSAAPAPDAPAAIKVLVPIDGTANSERAVRHVIDKFNEIRNAGRTLEVHLLNVQKPFSRHVALFSSGRNRESYHQEESAKALRGAHALLYAANVPHTDHVEVGSRADIIAGTAQRLGCDHIVIGTARKNSITRMFEASVTNQVIERSNIPVEVIPGDAVSALERLGVPAGLCAAILLLGLSY